MMTRLMLAIAAALLAATAAAAAQGPAPAAATPAGNADNGRALYTKYGCYQCHGREAQGSSATGPRLGPRPLPFAAFTRYVRNPSGQMPPYTARVVQDAELADIYAFIQSRPAPPAVASLPLLK